MLDFYSYTSPSRVKTLVVPTHNLSLQKFEEYFHGILSKYYEVRLVDVNRNNGLFNPQGYPHGRVVYDYQLVDSDTESLFLNDFEPFRKMFNVIGICSYDEGFVDVAEEQLIELKKYHNNAINYNIIAFDTPIEIVGKIQDKNKNIFYLPKITSSKLTNIETILCDVTSNFLEALSNYASAYQHVTLRSPGSITNNNNNNTTAAAAAITTTTGFSSGNTLNSKSKRSISGAFSLNGGSSSPTLSTNSFNSTHTITTEKKKKRISSANFLPNFDSNSNLLHQERLKNNKNKGRQHKIFGNFYLLSGRLNDALKEFCECINLLKSCNDFLWLGSALDGLSVCVLILTFLEVPFQLPLSTTSIINTVGHHSSSSSSISTTTSTSTPGITGKDSVVVYSPNNSPRNSMNSVTRTISNQMNNGTNSPSSHQTPGSLEYSLQTIPELVNKLVNKCIFYYKLTFENSDDCVPGLVYCETLVRYIKFMTVVSLNKGLDFHVLRNIVKSTPLPKEHCVIDDGSISPMVFDKLEIMRFEQEIFNNQFEDMAVINKCRIYCSLIAVCADLDLLRKRSFLLRQLFFLILPELQDKKFAINTAITISGSCKISETGDETALTKILDDLLKSYGISTDPNDTSTLQSFVPNWMKLHKTLLKNCIKLVESLSLWKTSLRYNSILLKNYSYSLSEEEQVNLLQKMRTQYAKLKHTRLDKIKLLYWDEYLVRDISAVQTVNQAAPVIRNSRRNSYLTNGSHLKQNIYNPYSNKNITAEDERLVEGEPVDIRVTMQNPFLFDIDISKVQIHCNDFKIKTVTSNASQKSQLEEEKNDFFVIKANSIAELFVSFIPLQKGELKILGIKAIVCGCDEQVFEVCLNKNFKVFEKIKTFGIEKFLTKNDATKENNNQILYDNDYSSIEIKTLKYHVLSAQPMLSLVDMSLNNNWVMLLEGETKEFSISLKNISSVEINHLISSFIDSTTTPLSKALATKLPGNEVYEIEYYLIKKIPFRILNKENLKLIKNNEEFKIDLEIVGKRGMTSASVLLEYSNNTGEEVDSKYIRNIEIPVNVTVYPSVEISSCDILALFTSETVLENSDLLKALNLSGKFDRRSFWSYLNNRVVKKNEKMSDYCLLVIDLRNSWRTEIEVELRSSASILCDDDGLLPLPSDYDESDQEKSDDCCVTSCIIERGATERFLLPIKRISLPQEQLSQDIPSLRNKQFIFDKTTPKEEQNFIREAFWYRQELLRHIKGVWSIKREKSYETVEVEKTGNVELRGVRLSSRMLNILKVESVGLEQFILRNVNDDETSNSNQLLSKKDNLAYDLKLEDFYIIKTKIINRTHTPITGILRHVPVSKSSSLSIERKILFNGVLQYTLPSTIMPGESFEVDLGICILEKGEYEWRSIFDQFEMVDDKISEGKVDIVGSHAQRESLLIKAN
ncbi:hypothetical protein PACTADRAFT_31864 [Pachysolen tannophilus NRRL Y-2460]|uniref:Uncharacterized protein n=1 Tax=Pachysolen tannophilus NRRL Y-2460 TaxID=669874 RepID=A0A1E4U3A4_PACTA|nr:hypothetical protein PACTADRAFT_31864 [Pachysolen tannophilus NRRL Y-2460]